MTALTAIMDALATQINVELGSGGTSDPLIENLQVDGRLNFNPTPPAVDVYPADPFQEALSFGKGYNSMFLTVRARASTVDNEGGQDLLLSMMDPTSVTSMEQAIESDKTLGGTVGKATVVEGPSAYGVFPDAGGGGSLIGCVWRVQVIP